MANARPNCRRKRFRVADARMRARSPRRGSETLQPPQSTAPDSWPCPKRIEAGTKHCESVCATQPQLTRHQTQYSSSCQELALCCINLLRRIEPVFTQQREDFRLDDFCVPMFVKTREVFARQAKKTMSDAKRGSKPRILFDSSVKRKTLA